MTAHVPGRPLIAIGAKLASVSLFVVVSALVKTLDTIPTGQIVFFRSALAIPVIVVWVAFLGQLPAGLSTKRPLGHVWRGLIGACSMALTFTALSLLPLPEVTVLSYLAPLLVVVLASAFLGEKLKPLLIFAVFLGLIGVALSAWPQMTVGLSAGAGSPQFIGVAAVLAAALCAALVQVQIRSMVRTETISAIVFWFSVTSMTASLFTIPFGWIMPEPGQMAVLILCGLLGGLAQMLMTTAYRYGDASLVAPFDYWAIVLALILSIAIFAEFPTATMLGGAGLIILAGLLVIWQERKSYPPSQRGVRPHG